MTITHLDYYFDFISPFSFFSWHRLPKICEKRGIELRIHPVVFGKLLDHWGQLGPAEIPPKKENIWNFCYRLAAIEGLSFNSPKYHPYHPIPSLRVSLKEVCGIHQTKVVDAIFSAGWTQGRDLGDPQELEAILNETGLDGPSYLRRTKEPAVKEMLFRETQNAIDHQVFGVPTCIVADELFWGYDQLDHLEQYLDNHDSLDKENVQEMLNRPRGIDRKRG